MCCTVPDLDEVKKTECIATGRATRFSNYEEGPIADQNEAGHALQHFESLEDLKPITEMASFEESISPVPVKRKEAL